MPITKSAKKALRQSERKRIKNLQQMRKMKNLLKKVKGLASQKKTKEAKELMPQVYKALDKAAKIGLIKKNTAAKKKSKITKLVNKSK